MAKNLCQTFMDARLFESASDRSRREFHNKGIYQVTGKGAHIVEKFVHRNALSIEGTRHITANATPRILFLERTEDEDAIVLNHKTVDAIFKRFAGLRPNVIARVSDSPGEPSSLASSPGRDRVQTNIDRYNGIEVKDQQHNYDMYKHTFYGKAAVDWLLDYTTVISKEEAICIAQEMVTARYIEQVGEEHRSGQTLFKTGNSALYHFTELGRAVLGWESLIRSRGSSINTDWMDDRGPTGPKTDRSSSEPLSTQFKLTWNSVPRLPISIAREECRSADESSLNATYRFNDESMANNEASRRLSQILNDPALQILSEPGPMSSYAPSSSGKESVGHREGETSTGGTIASMGSTALPTTSNTTRLNLILSNVTLRDMFKNFLKQNICEENLAFYLEVLDYKNMFNMLINATRSYTQSLSDQEPLSPTAGSKAGSANISHPASLRELEKQICTQAFAIYETFLVSGAPRELNLPHQMRQDITAHMEAVVRNMNAPSPPSSDPLNHGNVEHNDSAGPQRELIHISLFDRIHEHIFRLMSTDSVPKFTKTDKYREMMMNRVRQRDNSLVASNTNGTSTNVASGLGSPTLGGTRTERLERSTTAGA
ncbi:hypothetical protein BGX34_000957 [Mortierella sp. NVP85]|nr:hypothetical protein BGX34_000957 [Mortierella sp. NVP85]